MNCKGLASNPKRKMLTNRFPVRASTPNCIPYVDSPIDILNTETHT